MKGEEGAAQAGRTAESEAAAWQADGIVENEVAVRQADGAAKNEVAVGVMDGAAENEVAVGAADAAENKAKKKGGKKKGKEKKDAAQRAAARAERAKKLRRLLELAHEAVFGKNCVCAACGEDVFDDGFFCAHCLAELPLNDGYVCSKCGRAIEADYRAIEHRRHMNEITYEEELELLEQLRRKHRLNAEEIMEWEEKVYDLRQEIRERDAASLDSLSDGVLTALENRYEAMLEAERQRLDESRDSWEKWRDERVAAIEAQIAALDRLADAQDREKRDAEELRKIAKLEQLIAYEQDDYNRAKLTQQLDQAVREREERLRSLALEDEKEALRAQIEAIEKEADARLEALEREEADVEAAYAQRMEEAALRAEAEKLILTQSQDELLSLIESYAPAYDAAGQTLGEKLLEGFSEKVGSIAQWFEDFNAQIARAQAEVAGASQEAAERFYQERGLTVHQTVTFNEPVDSPAQVARRVEQANRELALML